MTPADDSAAALAAAHLERARADAELLKRTAGGDRDAFSQLYDRFSRPLYSVALRILNNAAEAEDIVQDVFLALWEKAGSFETARGSAFAWAVTLTRNRAIDRVRMRTRRSELLTETAGETPGVRPTDNGPDSAEQLATREHSGVVRAAVASLPPDQKKALELAFFDGLTQQEISTRLRQPLGTIKARIRRGLLRLRDLLEGRHD